MNKIRTFKIEQKFKGTENLYKYLLKNVDFISESIGIIIQKPLKIEPFCVVGKEKITERTILFFATKSNIPEDLGELLTLTGTLEPHIIVFLLCKATVIYIDSFNWLQNICNDDTQFIVGEVKF